MFSISKFFVAVSLLFTASYASATVPSFPTEPGQLTAEQCTKLELKLEKYIAYINAWLAKQPRRLQRLLKPYVDYAIREAQEYVDKVCPEDQGPELRTFECSALNSAQTELVLIGLNSGGSLSNDQSQIANGLCMTEQACTGIISQKYFISGAVGTSRCAAGSTDPNIVRASDSEIQSLVNQVP